MDQADFDWMTSGVRRIAVDRVGWAWAERVMVANVAGILVGRGYFDVREVPAAELEAVFADNTFAL